MFTTYHAGANKRLEVSNYPVSASSREESHDAWVKCPSIIKGIVVREERSHIENGIFNFWGWEKRLDREALLVEHSNEAETPKSQRSLLPTKPGEGSPGEVKPAFGFLSRIVPCAINRFIHPISGLTG